ncbi:bacillithiol biosynthesis cysteine-adding enzyme BshC [Sporosarcina sp. 179-K 3D1 HS]|uniref:bacillithiol biosynthesis cysteine-adding enzyme BshC n=1 Tax=Sporosarcina sp. 179-K 3D1 HS TaxID=3232169 RepID=UPI00399FD647
MELQEMALPVKNKVMQSYQSDIKFVHTFFDYENTQESYPDRMKELSERTYKRTELADAIREFMKPFGISVAAHRHIEELGENAVAVIGGQQAGIMTGPLYSVHKAITVILLAKKQRENLGVPVVPVFWVAGEDHDLNEINHVYTESSGRIAKNQYPEKTILKLMASDAVYDQQMMRSFVRDIFGEFGETSHTKRLLVDVLDAVEREKTFTAFFVRLMNGLFQEEGLLFIDSAYPALRQLESEYFSQFIEDSPELAHLIYEKEKAFDEGGFGTPIMAQEDAAHLFYVHETGRILLSRENGEFVNRASGLRFSKEELLHIAETEPWKLSNNVASRPLMQDLVFPVLAFVGGPGEIAYWAVLKDAFHHFEMKMPIIVPRMSITLIKPPIRQELDKRSFSFPDIMAGAVANARDAFIAGLADERFESLIVETERLLSEQYEKMTVLLGEDYPMVGKLIGKNLEFHKKQISYLVDKKEEADLLKNDAILRSFDLLEADILPNSGLQERVYTPYSYMNEYGPTLIEDLLKLPFTLDTSHKIVYL